MTTPRARDPASGDVPRPAERRRTRRVARAAAPRGRGGGAGRRARAADRGRPSGILLGHQSRVNLFVARLSYAALAKLRRRARARRLRDPDVSTWPRPSGRWRERPVSRDDASVHRRIRASSRSATRPTTSRRATRASRRSRHARAQRGRRCSTTACSTTTPRAAAVPAAHHTASSTASPSCEMLPLPPTVFGLGDGGRALRRHMRRQHDDHMLAHWARPEARRAHPARGRRPAADCRIPPPPHGFTDRGAAAGMKGDVNVIDPIASRPSAGDGVPTCWAGAPFCSARVLRLRRSSARRVPFREGEVCRGAPVRSRPTVGRLSCSRPGRVDAPLIGLVLSAAILASPRRDTWEYCTPSHPDARESGVGCTCARGRAGPVGSGR